MSFMARGMDGFSPTAVVITSGTNGTNIGYGAGTVNFGTLTSVAPKSKMGTNTVAYIAYNSGGGAFQFNILSGSSLGAGFFRSIVGSSGIAGSLLASAATFTFGAFNGVTCSQWAWTTGTFAGMINATGYTFKVFY
jgi:hypothetical protein